MTTRTRIPVTVPGNKPPVEYQTLILILSLAQPRFFFKYAGSEIPAGVFITIFCLLVLAANDLHAVTVTDDTGARVTLQHPARRIISLAPYVTELLYAAGAGNKIVGAVRFSYYPEAAKSIPRIGDTNKLDLERIVALNPDLIVAWKSSAAADTAILRSMHIPIYVSEPRSLRTIAHSINVLGSLSGTSDAAHKASTAFLDRLALLRKKYSHKPVITVFYQFWNDPIFTINGRHIISSVMRLCGGRNVFANMHILSAQVSLESVIKANPEVIIASGTGRKRPAWLNEWNKWPELTAVKHHQIYYIPPDFIQRQTPRILHGAAMMCKFLDEARSEKSY